ncbi:carbamoyltransferase family protein [Chitinophaga silvisoli]|uniref:Carbamoyltransferase n=1 Tax=Chitinophaga silvisoli TaxID=2291814 RepID=A0A3E1P992_9BACT|nr:carbamoyltransferase C-terminal domain-containing protein [Chitinophaga silvisoli]RFM36752.1 carbamoyltransferase [Chitinophaga silvisoli]
MYTLGINAAFHDSAACILKDGQLLAAAEDERFTHVKHGKRPIPFSAYELPFHAIDYCLKTANIHLRDVDHIAYSFDPYLLMDPNDVIQQKVELPLDPTKRLMPEKWLSPWDPLFLSSIINAPGQLIDGYPHHLQERFREAEMTKERWHFIEHHLSHASSAFLPSPYMEAAVLTVDGRGEKATTTFSMGSGNDLRRISQVDMPHSLGLLYEKVTSHLGFLHSSDEYKVMALASYGKPVFTNAFRSMINMSDNGIYTINDDYMVELLGPARKKGDPFTDHHFNIAYSLQQVLQESVLELASWLKSETGAENLCFAGGVALNCVLNAKLRDAGLFKNIWVQPAAGDAGTALGAAMWVDATERKSTRKDFTMDHAYWGPEYGDDEIESFLKWTKTPYRKMTNIAEETADLLIEDKIIGWFQGRMEFGPRALGSRSILASPLHADMQARLNEVKDREDFRPVAPVVMEDKAAEWFEGASYSPFMLFVYEVKEEKRGMIPAVTHVDGTARIQTVNREQHEKYYNLLEAFYKKTGVPVLINTSFNTLGKPIVCTPRDAIECFWSSPFDALVIGSFLVEKQK